MRCHLRSLRRKTWSVTLPSSSCTVVSCCLLQVYMYTCIHMSPPLPPLPLPLSLPLFLPPSLPLSLSLSLSLSLPPSLPLSLLFLSLSLSLFPSLPPSLPLSLPPSPSPSLSPSLSPFPTPSPSQPSGRGSRSVSGSLSPTTRLRSVSPDPDTPADMQALLSALNAVGSPQVRAGNTQTVMSRIVSYRLLNWGERERAPSCGLNGRAVTIYIYIYR